MKTVEGTNVFIVLMLELALIFSCCMVGKMPILFLRLFLMFCVGFLSCFFLGIVAYVIWDTLRKENQDE